MAYPLQSTSNYDATKDFVHVPATIGSDAKCALPSYLGKTLAEDVNALISKRSNPVLICGNWNQDDGTNAGCVSSANWCSTGTSELFYQRGRVFMPPPYVDVGFAFVACRVAGPSYVNCYISNFPVPDTLGVYDFSNYKTKSASVTINAFADLSDTANTRYSGTILDVPIAKDRLVYVYISTYAVSKLGSVTFYAKART